MVREELDNNETFLGKTKWKFDNVMKLLEISVEPFFNKMDGKIYDRDGLLIGKSISKPLTGTFALV